MLPIILAAITFLGIFEDASPLKRIDLQSIGPKVEARSVIVLSNGGQVLWSKNPLEKRSIASLTKLMTALVVLDTNPQWSKKVRISLRAQKQEPVRIKLKAQDKVALKDLWYASLMASANDAVYALVESVGLGEEEAVKLMNDKVVEFNLVNTKFADVTGLSKENISTAEDMALIFDKAIKKKMIAQALSRQNYTWMDGEGKKHLIKNTNKLLGNFPGLEGGKTGYIEESGYNFAMAAQGPRGWGGLAVILGSPSEGQRFVDMKNSLAWAFSHYIMKKQ